MRVQFAKTGQAYIRNDYYPFGKRHYNLDLPTVPNETLNRFQFNGKESQFLGYLGYLDYGWRMHDPEIGRSAGFANAIAKGGDGYKVIVQQTANFLMDEAQTVMDNIIQSYQGQFDTVFCHTDEMSLGVVAALKNAGLTDITVLGIDGQKPAVEKIVSGEMTAVATCDTLNGELIYSMVAAYFNGEPLVKETTIPSEIIDATNAEEALTNGMAF